MITSEYNHKDKIIYAHSSGSITLNDMISTMRKTLSNDEHPRDLKILENAIEADAKFDLSDVKHLKNLIDMYAKKFNSINHAVVHTVPKNAALGMWFEENSVHSKYKLRVFSSERAAKEWLRFNKPENNTK